MLQDFVERVSTVYGRLTRTPGTHYCNRLNAILTDTQMRVEYVRRYRIFVGEHGHSLRIDKARSDEELGDRLSS